MTKISNTKQNNLPDNNREIQDNNRDEMGRFIPGISGNLMGRPVGSGLDFSITAEIKRKLLECPKGKKKTYGQLIIETIFNKAIKGGDTQMLKEIWHQIDGKAKQSVQVNSSLTISDLLNKIEDQK